MEVVENGNDTEGMENALAAICGDKEDFWGLGAAEKCSKTKAEEICDSANAEKQMHCNNRRPKRPYKAERRRMVAIRGAALD
ncbi:hypothetical protein SUGI_0890690 [Cryptomeria japonica]|nr:hypothetical protein SUGI_0890690 [Cryptomeria japonica]